MMRRRRLVEWCAAALGLGVAGARAGAYDDFFRDVDIDNGSGVSQLLARGMDPNAFDPRGHPGLFLALRAGSSRAFEALMAHPEIRIDLPNAHDETPLMMAALRGNLSAMRSLIERGAAVRRKGWTPLHYAASGPATPAVLLLLERGADVDARAPNGNTPLMQAARYGPETSTELLLQRGADRSLRNERGYDAAEYARLDGREPVARRLEGRAP